MSEKNRISVHSPLSVSFSESPNGDTTGTILGADTDRDITDRDIKALKVPALKISCAGAFIVAASMLSACSARNGSLTGSALQANARFAAARSSQNSWSKSPSYRLTHYSEKVISERIRGGSILIARPAPQVNVMYAAARSLRLSGSEPRMLGFAPTSANDKDVVSQQLIATINRKASTIKINGVKINGVKITEVGAPGLVQRLSDSVPSGAYKVGLIQRNPRWYAPDAYYTRRNLQVPPAGSAPRFLKGALGIGALFLEPLNALNTFLQIPLHCAKEYTEDVGGIQLHEETYLELQSAVELGKTVVIE